jgi:hypothetical protein
MAKWWAVAGIFFIIILIGGIYVGRSYQYWVRAQAKIGELSSDLQEQAWRDFEGYAPGVMTGGILAGSAGDRIWVWNKLGVETLRVDENTVYSWFDGCSAEPLAELNQGIVGAVRRYLITDKDAWRAKAKVGDYVRAYVTSEGAGGTAGNLRELYNYNFWLFLPAGMEERCAK